MAAKAWKRAPDNDVKPLTEERKHLIERYMVDAEEAERLDRDRAASAKRISHHGLALSSHPLPQPFPDLGANIRRHPSGRCRGEPVYRPFRRAWRCAAQNADAHCSNFVIHPEPACSG